MSIKQRGWCRCAGCGKLGRGGAEKHTERKKTKDSNPPNLIVKRKLRETGNKIDEATVFT